MYIYTHILFQGPIANAGNFETQNSLFFSTNKVEVFNWINECCVFRHPREKCIANIRWKVFICELYGTCVCYIICRSSVFTFNFRESHDHIYTVCTYDCHVIHTQTCVLILLQPFDTTFTLYVPYVFDVAAIMVPQLMRNS